ncbi:hypothetical protein [Anaerocellum diazotrophicum]|uniref:Membrane protein YkvI n=1 Tax=Caldicellulosiruptor diazotrophicus TaxID=2806205 RepID=A0ABN6E5M7_9FIRM|nr:hypothetical protein [Caldicellulosiruptor diazotrophicus]BCS80738.1 hypothetical protein CaldiYA01_06980 [Caldicellulosiruptor diazotrophicus]
MEKIFAIVSTILGSIIGAGFSTGQEIFYFFSQFKEKSFLYIGFSSILIFLILFYLVNIRIKNIIILVIFKSYILVFSVITLTVMFSAFGQLGKELFGINKYVFTLLCVVLSFAIYKHGLLTIINLNKVVVSILIMTIAFIFSKFIHKNTILFQFKNLNFHLSKDIFHNLIFPLLYATYNSLLAFPVINNLEERFCKQEIKISIAISAVLTFLLILIINILLLSENWIQTSQMPLLKIEKNPVLQFVLVTCTFLEILTTILANYMGLSYSIKNHKIKFVIIIVSLILGFNEFQELLRKLYSLMGYIGLGIIIMILLSTLILKDKKLK